MLAYTVSNVAGEKIGILDIIDERVVPGGWTVRPVKKPNGEIVEFTLIPDIEPVETDEVPIKPSNLGELIEHYFACRQEHWDSGLDWDPRKETVYVTRENYEKIISDEAFGHTDGPDVVPITNGKLKTKRFWGMRIKVE